MVHGALAAAAVAGHHVGAEDEESQQAEAGDEEDGHEPAEGYHGFAVVGEPEDDGEADDDVEDEDGGGGPGGEVGEIDEGDGEVHGFSLRLLGWRLGCGGSLLF